MFKPLTFFLIIKKIKSLSFPSLKLEVKGLFNSDKKNKIFLKLTDPDNVVLEQSNLKTFKKLSFQKKYIQLFDCYGELCLRKLFLRKPNTL